MGGLFDRSRLQRRVREQEGTAAQLAGAHVVIIPFLFSRTMCVEGEGGRGGKPKERKENQMKNLNIIQLQIDISHLKLIKKNLNLNQKNKIHVIWKL